jgi:hypothetical protein
MPNPFPGMDPYLEGELWSTVHTDLAAEIARQLAPKVLPKYLVLSTQRIVVATPDPTESPRQRFPDVGVVKASAGRRSKASAAADGPVIVKARIPVRIPQTTVEIRDAAQRRLVTAIELLSPTNKRGDGRREYLRKRRQLLRSSAHLLEIDLLRVGHRFPVADPLPPAEYYVFLSRARRRSRVEVWPIRLSQPLPRVRVPLLRGDSDVTLDLQAALRAVYNILRYDVGIDYTRPPPGPLAPEQAAWVEQRLRAAGRRH